MYVKDVEVGGRLGGLGVGVFSYFLIEGCGFVVIYRII